MPFGPLLLAALVAASPSPAPPSPYAAFVAGAKRQSGLFDVLTKDDQLYFDLSPSNLDTTYVIEGGIARGIGNAFTGRALDALPLQFVRQGNRIFWEVPNANYVAPANATGRLDLDQSIVANSVIAVTPIVAEDAVNKRLIVAATPLMGDFEHVLEVLNPRPPSGGLVLLAPAAGYSLSATTTYALGAKAFPTNVDLLVNLGLVAPPNAPPSIADPRGFSIVMHYSIIALPANSGYQPRLADDRVGYFVDTLKDLNDVRSPTPYVRYIDRWDMRKGPIVFYLTNEIPSEYREPVRQALLAWNAAFARIGIRDAIEVRDQPADPGWDPDDARYSSVRWITSDTPSFGAYAGIYPDPYTGQIYRAEIVIDGEYLRTIRNGYENDVAPAVTESDGDELAAAQQAHFAIAAARVLGYHLNADRFVRQFVEAAVMHEAGHAFGLRHNFEASTYYSLAQINDAAFTSAHGISASVMDYLPVNIAPPGVRQGAYFQLQLGPYDYWAIKYGYDTHVDPRAVADESGRPAYRFGTDENSTTLSPDPRIAPFDLSSDPLGWANEQFAVMRTVLRRLDARYSRSGGSYYEERLAFLAALQNQLRTASLAARYVGGMYTSRTHRGEPGARAPFSPLPRATSRRAFAILAANVFAPDAFTFPAQLMRDLGPDYFNGWGISTPPRTDLPATGLSDAVQGSVLNQLFSTINVARIYDVEATSPRGQAMSLADLFEWTRAAAFAEFPAHPNAGSAAHREFQRQYVDVLVAYTSAPSLLVAGLGVPREAQALARYELEQVRRTVRAALNDSSLDITTRAHLEDLESRCDRTLHGVNVLQP